MNLSEFVRRIELAESVGFLKMAPLDYQQGMRNVQVVKDLANALAPFRKEALRLKEKVDEQRASHPTSNRVSTQK